MGVIIRCRAAFICDFSNECNVVGTAVVGTTVGLGEGGGVGLEVVGAPVATGFDIHAGIGASDQEDPGDKVLFTMSLIGISLVFRVFMAVPSGRSFIFRALRALLSASW
jgi:hypothetical protein